VFTAKELIQSGCKYLICAYTV